MNCTNESPAYSCRMMADAARLSLAASAGCFVTAGFGCILNQFVPDAICAGGLAVVGCFYVAIGAVDFVRVRWLASRSQARKRGETIRSVQTENKEWSVVDSVSGFPRIDCRLPRGSATLHGHCRCVRCAVASGLIAGIAGAPLQVSVPVAK